MKRKQTQSSEQKKVTRNSVSPKETPNTSGVTPEKFKSASISKKVVKKKDPIKVSPVKSSRGQIHKELSDLSSSLTATVKKPPTKEQVLLIQKKVQQFISRQKEMAPLLAIQRVPVLHFLDHGSNSMTSIEKKVEGDNSISSNENTEKRSGRDKMGLNRLIPWSFEKKKKHHNV